MNPIATVLAVLQATIAIALLFVVPGLALGPVVAPGASTPLARIGRAAGVSLLAAGAVCTIAARLGLLRPTVVILAIIGLAILPLHSQLPRLPRRPRRRARRWWLAAAAAAFVVVGLVVVPSAIRLGPGLLASTPAVWYYANLARGVAASGGIPPELPEWGSSRPFQTDYLPFTAHSAAMFQLLPGDPLVQIEIYRVAILVGGLVLATLLFRRWVSTWLAVLGAMLLFATVRLDASFQAYGPAAWAFALALFALWLVDRALTEHSRRLALTAAAAATLVFLAHLGVFLVMASGIAGIAAARTLVASGGGPEAAGGLGHRHGRSLGIRLRRGRRGVEPAVTAIAIGLGGVVLGAALNAALVGEFRLLRYVGGATTETAPVLTRLTEIPAGWRFSGDATWDFYVAAVAPEEMGTRPPASFTDPRVLPRDVLEVWPGLDARGGPMLAVLLGLVAIPLLAWPALDARRQRLVMTWAVFGVVLAAGAYALFRMSDTFVPRRVGPSSLVPYELVVPVVAAVLSLWIIDRVARPAWRVLLPERRAMLSAGLALAVVATGMISPAPGGTASTGSSGRGLTPAGYEAYTWIAANTPASARILANAWTEGAIAAVARRTGIVDGRPGYLEDRGLVAESTALVLGARVVFADPASTAAAAYLDREAVDYVLVTGPGGSAGDLGGYRVFPADVAALAAGGRFALTRTFGDGRLQLFAVRPG
ncbi:MAG TPA: hypothetical protein VKA85_07605 [Candidatus Limnocylindrales bacterium]|nr:hypothetical protein [Candidatus Limnocylindrales bacterium]